MASGGTEEAGVLSGPWEHPGAETSIPWGYAGFEETTPLLTTEREDFDPEEPSQVQAGPWASKSSNPFDEDWVPLYEPLLQQEKFTPKLIDVSIPLPQLNKEDKWFSSNVPSALFGTGEVKNSGPSHLLIEALQSLLCFPCLISFIESRERYKIGFHCNGVGA